MTTINVKPKLDSVRVRNERVIRLKEELNRILELVVHSREALENELKSETAQRKLFIDEKFIKKLKELTGCYNALTQSRIQLDKAERTLEKELTPGEERDAVVEFIQALDGIERGRLLKRLVIWHNEGLKGGPDRVGKALSAEDVAGAD